MVYVCLLLTKKMSFAAVLKKLTAPAFRKSVEGMKIVRGARCCAATKHAAGLEYAFTIPSWTSALSVSVAGL